MADLTPRDTAIAACKKQHNPTLVERPLVGKVWRPHVPGSCPLAWTVMNKVASVNGHEARV